MESKNSQVRRLVASGDYRGALRICKDWIQSDPKDREQLRRGYECLLRPRFYKMINKDPELEYQRAVEVLKRIYG